MVEQVFSTATFWTWDSRFGGKLKVMRLWLSLSGMTPIADKQWNNNNLVQLVVRQSCIFSECLLENLLYLFQMCTG